MNNLSEDRGGAIDCGDGAPLIERCVFLQNAGGTGGGICAQGPATIIDCVFIENTVDHTEYGGLGGGLAVLGASPARIINCIFLGCASKNKGGAVYVEKDTSATFVNCTFSGNQAGDGSGFCLSDAGPVTLVNSIIAFGEPGAAVSGSGAVDISCSDVFGNAGGDWAGPIAGQLGISGNISADPLFVDSMEGDVHLRYDSPCRDSGDSGSPELPDKDWEGDPRVAHGFADMGADEFHGHLYWTGDAAPGQGVKMKIVGLPMQPTLLCVGTDVLNPPMVTKYGDWYLQYPIYLMSPGTVPWEGVIELPARIPPAYPAPAKVPLQAFLRDELTNLCVMGTIPPLYVTSL